MDKIIFLDVDGVLNTYSDSHYSYHFVNTPYVNDIYNVIERIHMRRLEYILYNIPDLKVVLSSSWHLPVFIKHLEDMQFKYIDRIIGRTPRKNKDRGQQILDWIADKEIDYLVLEDEMLDVEPYIDKKHLIYIDMNEGIQHKNAIEICKYFDVDEPKMVEYNLDKGR